jgi:hypothetical protein
LLLLAGIGLFAAHQLPARYQINIAEAQIGPTLNNFYDVEQGSEGRYRWTRDRVQVQMRALDSSLHICLEIANTVPGPRQVQLALNPKDDNSPPFQTFQLQSGTHQYCADTGRLAGFLPGNYAVYKDGFLNNIWFGPTLEIRTSPIYQPPGDRRELGTIIKTIEVSSAASAGRLGWPTLLESIITLLVAGGIFWLLQSFWLPWWAIFGGALGPVLGWLALVAFNRAGLADKIELTLYLVLATLVALLAARYAAPRLLPDLRRAVAAIKKGAPLTATALKEDEAVFSPAPPVRWQKGLAITLIAVALAILALNIVLPLLPLADDGNWGLKRFAVWPWPLVCGVVVGLAILLAGFYGERISLPQISSRLKKLNPYWGLLLLGLAIPILFYLLRTRDSYGDGSELVNKLKLFLQYRQETGKTDFLIWREREPLDFALHFVLWRALLGFEWWKPEYTYIFTSVLAGGVFVVVGRLVANMLTRLAAGRWLVMGLLFSAGTMLVFFGYTESYTLPTLAALIYLWLGLLALSGKATIAWPAAALAIAVMLHPQTIFLGPSFVVLLLWRAGFFSKAGLYWRQLRNDAGLALLTGGTCLAAFGLLFCMYNYSWQQWGVASQQFGGADNGAFKPLLASAIRPKSREIYPILSFDYLTYQFNLQMLVAPLALALIACVSGGALLLRRPGRGWWVVMAGVVIFFVGLVWVGAQAVLWLILLGIVVQVAGLWLARYTTGWLDPLGFFLGTAALYTWLFSLAWNPDLGAFDWDLLSLNGIFTSLFAGYLITKTLGHLPRFGQLVTVILAVAFTMQTGWIIYNAFLA